MKKSENCVEQDATQVDLDAWLEKNARNTEKTLGELIKKALVDGAKGALMEMTLAEFVSALSPSAPGKKAGKPG